MAVYPLLKSAWTAVFRRVRPTADRHATGSLSCGVKHHKDAYRGGIGHIGRRCQGRLR